LQFIKTNNLLKQLAIAIYSGLKIAIYLNKGFTFGSGKLYVTITQRAFYGAIEEYKCYHFECKIQL